LPKVIYTLNLRRDAFDGRLVYREGEAEPLDPNRDFYGFLSWSNGKIYINYPACKNSLRLFQAILHELLHWLTWKLSLPDFLDSLIHEAV